MKKSNIIGLFVLVASTLLQQPLAALAQERLPPLPGWAPKHSRNFDWVGHTQHILNELRTKLNLAPGQMAAWDAWSGGVIKDAHQTLGVCRSQPFESW